jgi:catechol 2,3-dioxygenase-like lactoylglutathione lyase family enzyme
MNHINAAVDGYDRSVAFFTQVYGAQLIADMPKDEWHACLMAVGGVIFEFFAPYDDLLHARFGPHYVGVEYQTTDVPYARERSAARGVRIIRELGPAFHVHPLDALGVAFEFFDESFHAQPPPIPFLEPLHAADRWRDGHPLGIIGLKRYSVAVADIDSATSFMREYVDGTVLYDQPRSAIAARAVGVQLGDTVVELLAPVGAGPLERHVARGEGIRSVVWQVQDLGRARSYFAGRQVELRPGDADDALAISPEDNCGLLFEFAE